MSRRLIGLVLAVVLAAGGTFVLVSYVRGAEERAVAGEQSVEVLVVSAPVAKGEPASRLGNSVKTVLVPAKIEVLGSVADLEELGDKVAAVDLLPGEQLLASRFVTADEFEAQDDLELPEGLLTVTLSLSPERAVGGQLVPGSTVGVLASFDPFTVDGVEPGVDDGVPDGLPASTSTAKTSNSTHLILHKVLVTAVQVERLPSADILEDSNEAGVALAPTGNLLVTLAVDAAEVERVVFAAEHGSVWLAAEPLDAYEYGTQIQTRGTIYR